MTDREIEIYKAIEDLEYNLNVVIHIHLPQGELYVEEQNGSGDKHHLRSLLDKGQEKFGEP